MSILEESAKVRHDAQETSRLAALQVTPKTGTLRAAALRAVVAAAWRGLTDDELCASIGRSPNSVRPRRVELVEGGFIIDSGLRRPSNYGNASIVWIATNKGDLACQ